LQIYQIELEMQNEELKRAREEVEEVLTKYTDLYDFAPVGYLTFDEKGLISELNLTAARLLGVERSFFVNKHFSSFIQREFQDRFHLRLQDVLETPAKQVCELVLRKKDGISFDAQIESIVAQVRGCRLVRSVLTDITARKQAEVAIQRFASFPQLNPNPVLETDMSGKLLFSNPATMKIIKELALKKEDIVLFLPKDLDTILRDWDKKTPQSLFREVVVKSRIFGETIQLGPEFKSARFYCHEITKRKQAEKALNKIRDELEERVQKRTGELSDAYDELRDEVEKHKKIEESLRQAHKMEAIGTLAGGIAHDFNNLLAAIMGFTEMVIEDLPEGCQEEKNLRHVLKSAHRGRDLVKQILSFSRKSDYIRGPMSLTPLIIETIQLLRASISSTVKIVFKTTATLDTVLASPTEIQQILMNLATNAALAMQDNGGTLDITLNDIDLQSDTSSFDLDLAPGEYIQLVVRDAGNGMTPEVMKRIFEPFFTTREVGKGTGMGLAVVYGIVTDLHGTITVESESGVGTLFRVFLPKIKSNVTLESTKADESPGGSERVLFLDDEELLVEWGHAALTRLGYKATSMTDSIKALKTFSDDPSQFDLVITDQTMPGLTGMQLARELLALRRDIPIILFTGHSDTVTEEEAQATGIREFLMKPFGKQELAGVIRRVLDDKS